MHPGQRVTPYVHSDSRFKYIKKFSHTNDQGLKTWTTQANDTMLTVAHFKRIWWRMGHLGLGCFKWHWRSSNVILETDFLQTWTWTVTTWTRSPLARILLPDSVSDSRFLCRTGSRIAMTTLNGSHSFSCSYRSGRIFICHHHA